MRTFILLLTASFFLLPSCNQDKDDDMNPDNFDRRAMLVNWADNIIIPSYEAYVEELNALVNAKDDFLVETNTSSFDSLQEAWLNAYIAWQEVSMFEIGKAEQLTLRDYSNIFPTDSMQIEENMTSGSYNLELPSTRDEQGFPAIDYLLFGSAATEADILSRFQNEQDMADYLDHIINRVDSLSAEVLSDWQSGYRDVFVENDGSDASSSVNKLLNDYLFYYEKALRAGKIGIPAGVFSTTPFPSKVEGRYAKEHSKLLFKTSLQAVIDFFNGVHYDGSQQGESIHTYLQYLNTITEGEPLDELINEQFEMAQIAGDQLNANFYQQIMSNNTQMLETYDELQKNVVLMKVDMFQALNVKVDYVDADGD